MRLVVLLFCLLLGVGAENAYAKPAAKNTKSAPAKSAPAKKSTKATTKRTISCATRTPST